MKNKEPEPHTSIIIQIGVLGLAEKDFVITDGNGKTLKELVKFQDLGNGEYIII